MIVPNNDITFSFTGKERDSETGFGYFGARYYASSLPVQHLQYLPFGEPFVNEQIATYSERFTFTGKERDAETGYYYHGTRFNSSDIGWLSVDPMADKYPSLTPYNYCAWNPVKLVDPTGMMIDWYKDENGNILWSADVKSQETLPNDKCKYIGPTYKGLSIKKYETFSGYHIDTYDPIVGLTIEATFSSENNNSDSRWVQTILNTSTSNCQTPYNDPCENPDDKPFYYTDKEISSKMNNGVLLFGDGPARIKGENVYWRAELSAVSNEGNGYQPIVTFRYGFYTEPDGNLKLLPIGISKPISFTIETINIYNNEK